VTTLPEKVLRGSVTIWAAYPEADIDWSNPSAADIDAAVTAGLILDISCAITDDSGDSLNITDRETDDTQSICDIATVSTPTFINYEAALDGFRNKTGTTDTPYYDLFFDLFNGVDREYWLIKRVDKKQGEPIEENDIISAFRFKTDYGMDMGEDGGVLMFGARFKPQGEVHVNESVVA
jgi:hypothetical protein